MRRISSDFLPVNPGATISRNNIEGFIRNDSLLLTIREIYPQATAFSGRQTWKRKFAQNMSEVDICDECSAGTSAGAKNSDKSINILR